MEFEGKVSLFLKGLARLSEETGIYVTGCGCCDSPDLCDLDERERKCHENVKDYWERHGDKRKADLFVRPLEYSTNDDGGNVALKTLSDLDDPSNGSDWT